MAALSTANSIGIRFFSRQMVS